MQQLIYHSEAIPNLAFSAVKAILRGARRDNAQANITGLLFYDGRHFIQVLEGEETAVNALYARICADRRHHHVRLLLQKPISQREFGSWTMAFACPETESLSESAGWQTYPPAEQDEFDLAASQASHILSMFVDGMVSAASHQGGDDCFTLTIQQQTGRIGRMLSSASTRDFLVEMGRSLAAGLPETEVVVRSREGSDISFNKRGKMKEGDIELF